MRRGTGAEKLAALKRVCCGNGTVTAANASWTNHGGAIAIGHPLGMSGARLVVSLLHELRRRVGRYGPATLCAGVGQGRAARFERIA